MLKKELPVVSLVIYGCVTYIFIFHMLGISWYIMVKHGSMFFNKVYIPPIV